MAAPVTQSIVPACTREPSCQLAAVEWRSNSFVGVRDDPIVSLPASVVVPGVIADCPAAAKTSAQSATSEQTPIRERIVRWKLDQSPVVY